MWPLLTRAAQNHRDNKLEYPEILRNQMEKSNESIAQIEKDLHRTMPRNEYFDKDKDIPRLRSVLVAYSWINPYVSFCYCETLTENGVQPAASTYFGISSHYSLNLYWHWRFSLELKNIFLCRRINILSSFWNNLTVFNIRSATVKRWISFVEFCWSLWKMRWRSGWCDLSSKIYCQSITTRRTCSGSR